MIARQTSLSANVVAFCRFLRAKGFTIGVEETSCALQALTYADLSGRAGVCAVLKAALCRNRSQLNAFDELFATYWKELDRAVDAKIAGQQKPAPRSGQQDQAFKALKSWLNGQKNTDEEETAYYGLQENLARRDFAAVPNDERDELMRLLRAIARRLAARLGRRREASHKHRQIDLRRTMRANLRRGGELMELAWQKPRPNRAKLVVLCDVSQSMDLYAAFLIQFMHAFQQAFRRVETFSFSTDLQRITHLLHSSDYQEALHMLGQRQQGWSGGTRIGQAFSDFYDQYGRSLLDKRTTVIILSDGLDAGDLLLLSDALSNIRARSRRLIWLNPLAGYPDYRPDAAGMQAAWPHLDLFAPAHNAESLRALGKML